MARYTNYSRWGKEINNLPQYKLRQELDSGTASNANYNITRKMSSERWQLSPLSTWHVVYTLTGIEISSRQSIT
jgi:hypothetical protein